MTTNSANFGTAGSTVLERQEILDAVFSQAADGLVLIDTENLRFPEFNDAACEALGYSRDEFRRLTLPDLQADLTPEQVRARIAELVASGGGSFEIRHLAKDGTAHDVWAANRAVQFQGKTFIVGVWRDITERRQTEARLRESERRFQDLATADADWWFWEMDADLRFSYFSENQARALGVRTADILGKRRQDLASGPDVLDKERWARHFDDLEHHRVFSQFEYRFAPPGATEERWISISGVPIFGDDGRFLGYRGTGQDISPRKRAEIKLAESEQRYRLLAENSSEWIYWIGPGGRHIYHSPACREITGYAADEFMADPALTGAIVHPDDRPRWERHQQERGGDRRELTFRVIRRDGETRWLDHVCQSLRDENGVWLGRRVTQRDLTERKRLEEELERHRDHLEELVAERTAQLEAASRAKSDFLANMSHEIRTPMNAIVALSRLAEQRTQDEGQLSLLVKVTAAAEHLLSVINDILDITRIEAGKIELQQVDFAIAQVVDNARTLVADQADEKGLRLQAEMAPDLPPVLHGDPAHLGQILINLLTNAIKFTDRGSVTVRVGLEQPWRGGSILCGLPSATVVGADDRQPPAGGVALRVEVEDTGIGIAPEACARLFEPFEQADTSITRRHGGTGLGLAIARRLVGLMGGEIGVASEPGRGSTFWFTALLARGVEAPQTPAAEASAATAIETALRVRCRGRSVLVVDDNPVNQEVTTELLRDTSLTVDLAEHGAEAVAKARARPYDIVLMDIQMPVMDGLEATRALRALPAWATIPVVAMSANAFADDRRRCSEAGMNDFLAKPVTPGDLFRMLLKWLPEAQAPMAEAAAAKPPAAVGPVGDDELRRRLEAIPGLDVAMGMQSVRDRLSTYARLLRKLVDSHGDDMQAVRRKLMAAECAEARRLAHSLKGVSATLGALDVNAAALALETALKAQLDSGACDAAAAEPLIVAVENVWRPLAAALDAALPT